MACKACHCPEISNSNDTPDQERINGPRETQAPAQPTNNSQFTSVTSEAMRDIKAIFNDASASTDVKDDYSSKTKRKRPHAGKRTLRALSSFFKTLFGQKKKRKDKFRSKADIANMKGEIRQNLLGSEQVGKRVYDSDAREIDTVPNTLTELACNIPEVRGRSIRRPDIKSYDWPATTEQRLGVSIHVKNK
jgi:hypothetical protein